MAGHPYRHSRVSGNPYDVALYRRSLGKPPRDSRLRGNDGREGAGYSFPLILNWLKDERKGVVIRPVAQG